MTNSIYWPGTNIIKSQGNAFTAWKGSASLVSRSKEWKQSQLSTQQMSGAGTDKRRQFTIYSKAVSTSVRPENVR